MLKKLLLIYWEIVPKHGSDGKLLHEMILVCDAYVAPTNSKSIAGFFLYFIFSVRISPRWFLSLLVKRTQFLICECCFWSWVCIVWVSDRMTMELG